MIYRYSVCVCDFYEICCNTWNTRNLGVQGPNIFVQKVIMSPQKCALIPQNRSFNHIYVTFSLKNDKSIFAENVTSRIYALLLAKFAKMPGLGGGGQTIFSNDIILGTFGPETPPLAKLVHLC